MKKKIVKESLIVMLLSLICLVGCSQNERIGLDPTDNIAPAAPTDILVENINGGAIISFTAPKDDDLLCVVASYIVNGIERTTKASPYTNKLKVEGFGTEGEYEITLKSLDKSKNESAPVRVLINPLTAPVELIFKSLKVVDSFGGVKLTWDNTTEVNIIVEAFKKDDDDWMSVENFYSSAKEGKATIRGFQPEPVTFKFRIRDRWDNYSDFLETDNLPLEEVQLDKSKFRTVIALPGDSPSYGSLTIDKIWDGNTVSSCYHGSGNDINRTITFDMGVVAKISRFKMWQRTESAAWIYSHNNLKRYVIYGCNEITEEMRSGGWEDETGKVFPTFEGWTEIVNVLCHKPSGDTGKVTNEDKEYILNGDEQEVPIDAPAFRYVRIYMLENWSGGTIAQIGEMTFWGQVVKN
ncbi:MAG: DUF5000 domain-containing lipoprotein [Bacteroides sp.]|uniref:DUF5000 domain-containing lipoprotein n=1 Tax=Bacteroides sp. TaxID=29523 RepID=UPI002FCC7128